MANNEAINNVLDTIMAPILAALRFVIGALVSNRAVAIIVFLILVNIIAVILIKRDKSYAQNEQRRIRESLLMIVALIGGSIGMYIAMFKYKHKTLHTKFTIGIPIMMVIQFAFLSYLVMSKILSA